ncbi:DNA-binding FadR family transcriptional regulator [Friedmanniella endophytica]|uniref:DNA-binding FadR family transcriptional regulator n=1 Tax=Microlunatus kandeliicorticis TaxID=1759536 RepID=A0A7W3IUF8_9ACTN|nr:FadR/GntR family transcriptional regulator [Microlunatus kandeliicorticis]MBA8795454.1 DNA-binding FadR family transcriptional regulator [Microlunatus kandeliicorticis]
MSLTDVAIDKIKQMIIDGRLQPGSRLPKESELADELGISRSSLREAVRALSLVRILDVRQGDGTYVTSLRPEILMEVMGFVLDLHVDASVLHLFEVRRALEPIAAEKAAVQMHPDEARGLLRLLDDVDPSADHPAADPAAPAPDVDALVANDIEFHRRIAEATGNPVLCSLLEGLSSRTQRARIWRGLTDTDATRRTLQEHRAIAQAIIDRRPDVARSWSTVHVAGVEDWIRRSLPADDED